MTDNEKKYWVPVSFLVLAQLSGCGAQPIYWEPRSEHAVYALERLEETLPSGANIEVNASNETIQVMSSDSRDTWTSFNYRPADVLHVAIKEVRKKELEIFQAVCETEDLLIRLSDVDHTRAAVGLGHYAPVITVSVGVSGSANAEVDNGVYTERVFGEHFFDTSKEGMSRAYSRTAYEALLKALNAAIRDSYKSCTSRESDSR